MKDKNILSTHRKKTCFLQTESKMDSPFNAIKVAQRVIKLEAESLKNLSETLDQRFTETLDCINQTKGRLILTGVGKSGHIARKIAATLASTGTPSYYVHPSEASHGDLGMITKEDAVLALSKSGETSEFANLIAYCRRYNIPLIAMTSKPKSTLGKAAHYHLIIPDLPEACLETQAPTTSTTLQIALGDALSIALLEKKGFTASRFQMFHPGGTLGSRLTRIKDIMHQGNSLPLVKEDCLMANALIIMSEKGFGCLGVISEHGSLTGMITDGDLRRHMNQKLLQKKASNVMTKSPMTASEDMLAGDVLRIMNEGKKRIMQIFITKPKTLNEKKTTLTSESEQDVIGLIHLHDLLRAGII